MFIVDEKRFPHWNLEKISETHRIAGEIINDLSPECVNEVLSNIGSERDMDIFFDTILETTYSTLFSRHTSKTYGSTNLLYFEKLSDSLEETLRCENFAYFTSSVLKDSFDIAWFHLEWFEIIQKYNYVLVEAARGHGKCINKNHNIIMYDGSLKKAGDIKIGDILLGPDNKPRNVVDVNFGYDEVMYKIKQQKGDDYIVNSKHTLTLLKNVYKNGRLTKSNDLRPIRREIIDIDVEDYIKLTKSDKKTDYGGFKVETKFCKDDSRSVKPIGNYNVKEIYSIEVEQVPGDEYVCITIDGDNRMLLSDRTVIHNSFLFSNALPAWYMYKFRPKNNTPAEQSKRKIMLFSFSIAQAIDLLAILKETIETNDILKHKLYDKNNFSKMELVAKNKTNVKVKGFGGSVRGAHPYYIIVDDGLKDNVMYSAEAREKSVSYFHSVIMNLLEPGGSISVVGTPFHSMDLYGDLKSKKGWHCYEYPAIFPDGRILWPERWSYQSLMDKRNTQGNLIFSRELLCRPITSDSTIFPIEVLNNAFARMEDFTLVSSRENYKIKFDRVVVGCDFAISSSVGADSSCFTVWGLTPDEKMYLLYIYHDKGKSFSEQIAQISWINRMFKPDIIYMEDNAMQTIFVQSSQTKGIPVRGFTTTTKKNSLRLGWPSLAILFENGRIKIPIGDERSKNIADLFITQFSGVAFTSKGLQNTNNHDDLCSSTFLGYQAAKELTGSSFDFTFV